MTYDLINEIYLWRPTNRYYLKVNPNRLWWQFWRPEYLRMEILKKFVDGEMYYVGYSNDGSRVVAEGLGKEYVESIPCTR